MTVLGSVRVTARTQNTLRPEVVLAPGPLQLGVPGAGTVAELYGSAWALALFAGGPRLFQVSAGAWEERTDGDVLAPIASGAHVALAFDQAARPVTAWRDGAQLFVRQWNPGVGYTSRGPFVGQDPLLIADAVVHGDPASSDVTLLHRVGDLLVARVQRENYATVHPLAALPPGTVLDQVLPGVLSWQVAGMAGRTPVYVRSGLYPLAVRGLTQAGAGGLTSGTLRVVVRAFTLAQHAAQAGAGGLGGGTRQLVVVARTLSQDVATSAVTGLIGGTLRRVVVTATLSSHGADHAASGLRGGALRRVGISISLTPDVAAGSASGLTGGALTHA